MDINIHPINPVVRPCVKVRWTLTSNLLKMAHKPTGVYQPWANSKQQPKNVSEQHDAKNFAHKRYWFLLDRVHVIRQETEDPRKWIGPALYWSSWNRRNNAV